MKSKHFWSKTIVLIFLATIIGVSSCSKIKNKKELVNEKVTEKEPAKPFFKLSLAQWSLHKQIRGGELSPLDFAQKSKELGFEGIEYVSQLYREELSKDKNSDIAMQNLLEILKMKSEEYQVKNVLIMVDGEGNLGASDVEERMQAVENHKKWVDAAAFLGCHAIRVNASGKGSKEEVANAAIDGLGKLSDYAAKKGINVLVENHGGYSSNAKWLANVMKTVGKPNCGTLPDFGNFCLTNGYGSINSKECKEVYDIYQGVAEMMPYAKAVSAKSYYFDNNGKQPKIDYVKMLQVVKDAGYTGFIGVEYEGNNLSEEDGILATKKLLLQANEKLK